MIKTKCAKHIGNHQFKSFFRERLIEETPSLYNTIKKNSLALYRQTNSVVISTSKQKVVNLSSDCRLYSKLCIASQAREGVLDEFFAQENHACPVSFSEYSKLRAAKDKSEITQLLHKVFKPQYEKPNVQMKRIDGTAFVNVYRSRTSKMFGEYYDDELVKVVYSFSEEVDRMDFAFDRYLENSIKTQAREGRGKGMRISVRRDTPLCEDFKTFMRDSDNKAELLLMFANSMSQIWDVPSIVATVNEKVI